MEAVANGRGTESFAGKGAQQKPHLPYRPWREQLRQDPLNFYVCQAHRAYACGRSAADVGRTVRASKRLFTWSFCFGPRGAPHVVELKVSVLSGKRSLAVDGRVVHSTTSARAEFAHAFSMDGAHLARVAAVPGAEDAFDLSVDAVRYDEIDRKSVV